MFTMQQTIAGLLTLFFTLNSIEAFENNSPKASQLTFDYENSRIELISKLPIPETQITSQHLANICKEVNYLIYSSKLSGMNQTLLPAYLANAQKDFAWLSYLLTGKLSGNIAPVTLWTLQLFLPEASLPSVNEKDFDVYSSTLAALIVQQVAKRLQQDRENHFDYPIQKGERLWIPTNSGYVGLNFGSMKTWYLTSSTQFVAETIPSNDNFWQNQCLQIKKVQEENDGAKIEGVFRWAGLSAPGAGNWHQIASAYLQKNNIPVMKQLYVRAVLFSALADSNAAAFNSKYTFWIKRPSQRKQYIKPLITVPNHPSYPSAHSTISATAAVILSHFFPEDTNTWQQLAEEAGMSRIWGGIHYPIDHKNGLKLGTKVGQIALETSELRTNQKS